MQVKIGILGLFTFLQGVSSTLTPIRQPIPEQAIHAERKRIVLDARDASYNETAAGELNKRDLVCNGQTYNQGDYQHARDALYQWGQNNFVAPGEHIIWQWGSVEVFICNYNHLENWYMRCDTSRFDDELQKVFSQCGYSQGGWNRDYSGDWAHGVDAVGRSECSK